MDGSLVHYAEVIVSYMVFAIKKVRNGNSERD